jgi:hypothetical protein
MHHPQNAMLASSCLASRSQEIWLIRLCVTSAAWTSILHCRRSKQASNSSCMTSLLGVLLHTVGEQSWDRNLERDSGRVFLPPYSTHVGRRRRAWKTNKHTTNCTPIVRAVRSATISKPQPCRKQDVMQVHKNQCWAMIPGRTTARTRTSA